MGTPSCVSENRVPAVTCRLPIFALGTATDRRALRGDTRYEAKAHRKLTSVLPVLEFPYAIAHYVTRPNGRGMLPTPSHCVHAPPAQTDVGYYRPPLPSKRRSARSYWPPATRTCPSSSCRSRARVTSSCRGSQRWAPSTLRTSGPTSTFSSSTCWSVASAERYPPTIQGRLSSPSATSPPTTTRTPQRCRIDLLVLDVVYFLRSNIPS
jgi:hypothetical protein